VVMHLIACGRKESVVNVAASVPIHSIIWGVMADGLADSQPSVCSHFQITLNFYDL
jgi:hypothetical protein